MRPIHLCVLSSATILASCLALAYGPYSADTRDKSSGGRAPATTETARIETPIIEKAEANELIQRQSGFFVPNLGQWDHPASFVHRSGPMTLFLQDRGWIVDLVERPIEAEAETGERGAKHGPMPGDGDRGQTSRGVALRMTFAGDAHVPETTGEDKLTGHHDYFLGNDRKRWRTEVPLYGSVRYENLYPGLDLRLREANGVPEYDLLLQPGADLSRVVVHVEGAQGLSIADDGLLVIETALGPLTQTAPKTWEVDADGKKREVACKFTKLGRDRFGFAAPGWDGDTSLTIDPALIWSTFLGGNGDEVANEVSVDASGVVTLTGHARSSNFPTTGAYQMFYGGGGDVVVTQLDPSKTGSAQLVYSTYLGGSTNDNAYALAIDASGVVTVAGFATSSNFPTTPGAYDRTQGGNSFQSDAFVTRLDPSLTGNAQLVYSTLIGGSQSDRIRGGVSVDARGVVTVAGETLSGSSFPTTRGAYKTIAGGGFDAFVSRLDPSKVGTGVPADQLVYSTLLGGSQHDTPFALSVDASGVVIVAGETKSRFNFTTPGAFQTTHRGMTDAFVSRLDPSKVGTGIPADQLVYSTFLGGGGDDKARGLSVDASGVGVTLTGWTRSSNFPTTQGVYDTTHNGNWDVFVSRLILLPNLGNGGLVYSTFVGESENDIGHALAVDPSGVVTVAGITGSANFPTTPNAYDTTFNGSGDVFVSRLDPSKVGTGIPGDQLVYSTFLGGSGGDNGFALDVDVSGVATVAAHTQSSNFPTTPGAYDTTFNGGSTDVFVSRLSMGVAFYADRYELSLKQAGEQNLYLDAGAQHAGKPYAIFGSVTGTSPGVSLLGIHIPLNLDPYTDITIGSATPPIFVSFKGTLSGSGEATASFHVPGNLPTLPSLTLHHAYVVYDPSGKIHMASNAVPLQLR